MCSSFWALALLSWPIAASAEECFFQDWDRKMLPIACPSEAHFPDPVPPPPVGAVWVGRSPHHYRAMPLFRKKMSGGGSQDYAFIPDRPGLTAESLPEFKADGTVHAPVPPVAGRRMLRVFNSMSHQMVSPLHMPPRPDSISRDEHHPEMPATVKPVQTSAARPAPPNAPDASDILAERDKLALEELKAAQESWDRRDAAAAGAHAGRSLEARPSPPAYFIRASARNASHDFRAALLDADDGLGLQPNDPLLLGARSYALNHQGMYQDALAAAEAGLKAGGDAGLYANKAYALSHLGNRAAMLEALERAAAIDPAYGLTLREAKAGGAFPSRAFDPNREAPIDRGDVAPQAPTPQGPGPLPLLILFTVGGTTGFAVAAMRRSTPAAPRGSPPLGPHPAPGPQASPALARTQSGQSLLKGRYELQSKIGAGGMGDVFKGLDRTFGRAVAIKKMRSEIKNDKEARAAFLREASIVSHLSHPYIVAIHEVVEDADDVYLIFDYVDGKPLSQILAERKRLPLAEVQRLFTYVCEAISCAHHNHVLHRDLKPSNIMVDGAGYAKVMDFGIAREAKETITRLTNADAWGTPAYMAPEQHLGRCAKTSDIFALGVCLYETMTGQLPFPGPDFLAQKERRKYAPPQFLAPDLPKEAELLFAATLSPDPKVRVAEAAELLVSLQGLTVSA